MTAAAKAAVVVHTVLIRVPQIKQCTRYGSACARQDATLQRDWMPIGLRVYEIAAFRRIRPEIRAFGGRWRRLLLMLVPTRRRSVEPSGDLAEGVARRARSAHTGHHGRFSVMVRY